jgi:hypothetical protein
LPEEREKKIVILSVGVPGTSVSPGSICAQLQV